MTNIERKLTPDFIGSIKAGKPAPEKPVLTEGDKTNLRSQEIMTIVVETYERFKTPDNPNTTVSFRGNNGDGGIVVGENIPDDLTPNNGELIEY